MDRSLKKYLKDGKFDNVDYKTVKTMAAIKGKNNKSTELKLRMALIRKGINGFKLNYKGLPGKPDFYFEGKKLAVFVDGCYWHGCPECGHIPKTRSDFWKAKFEKNKARDIRNVERLSEMGIDSIRIWEHELKDDVSLKNILYTINKAMSS